MLSATDYLEQVNPEDLGFIYENILLDKQNKSKNGIFYTPFLIASYMAKDTLLTYLEVDSSIFNEDVLPSLKNKNLKEKLLPLKIIDPSCGTAIFLTRIYKILLELYKNLHH